MAPPGGGNIKVVVRVRPFNGREIDRGSKCIVGMKDNQTILSHPAGHGAKAAKDAGPKTFAFDRSYWSFNKDDANYAGQSSLFDDLGKPLLDNAFQGYNNCIFAYGQTGSGKSYSMMGYGKEVGIIPNICQEMFERIQHTEAEDPSTKFTVEVSYLEIYNERVRDLLNPSTKGNLKVREHPSTGPYVEDLAKLVVGSFQEIENLMDEGNKARTVAATNMNETSSRSHAVFTLMLTQKKHDASTNMDMEKAAKISLVDLAGSERATSTGATGARLKEGAEINRSLSTLGRVIAALADLSTGKKKKGVSQVPYRDSVLTWLLKDSLGGNSMTAMIAAISPADINHDETLSTLRYADSAKRIKNHAVINEDANARMIRELKEELALLRSKLGSTAANATNSTHGSSDGAHDENLPLDQQMVNITNADGTIKKVSKAEIAEQLSQSEKLLTDLNQTWEQKLQKTEEIHKEREAALEELGISIEKGFIGLHTPKKMPHLVNLSDDPLLAECLVYNLKPGTTTVGNVDTNADHQANIRLNGTRILHDHCSFENAIDGTVTVIPQEGASVMVNGKRISEPTQLHSGFRVILGDFHIFRFNHPMEARAERAEVGQSLLRHSVTASQLQALDRGSPSPSPRPGHERSISKFSDLTESRSESPALHSRSGRDFDWSLARREAAGAILGTDQNFASLNDEELNALFEEVQRIRAERVSGKDDAEDSESVASYLAREKYTSSGTIDTYSLDTALTLPSTPKQGEMEEASKEAREGPRSVPELTGDQVQESSLEGRAAKGEVEPKREESNMEAAIRNIKDDMQKQLDVQRKEFEDKLRQINHRGPAASDAKLSAEDLERARSAVEKWRARHYVKLAESVLQDAAVLKEAQILSTDLNGNVSFQFTIIDFGHALSSSYDMVLNGLVDEGDDPALEESQKPCIGVRVIDFNSSVAYLWSLDKFHERLRQMRQMHQYLDQPEYAHHLSLNSPFVEACMPSFTPVGECEVSLKAVFQRKVQDYSLDVFSPYTSQTVGMMRLSLEPSHARAPSDTLKFNIVLHEFVGFAEREGTDVHAQLFIPLVSEDKGITTTQMIGGFDEGFVRFESVHNMSVPSSAPRSITLRIAIFARASPMHLDKLLSWDDMRDARPKRSDSPTSRINESQFLTQEKHDLLSRLQILELDEHGGYQPVEVAQTSELDPGTFQLHQGLQRRISLHISHGSGDALPWGDVQSVRVGKIQLVDSLGKTPDLPANEPDVTLKLLSRPERRQNENGTQSVIFQAQWDSSLHESLLLDRVTAEKYSVQMSISWEIGSDRLAEPMRFAQTVSLQVLSRSFVRQPSMLSSLFQHLRYVRSSTCIFRASLKPSPIRRVGDLWRLNSRHDYIKGEENLTAWAPRGTSLISDFVTAKKRRRRLAEVDAVKDTLRRRGVDVRGGSSRFKLSPLKQKHHAQTLSSDAGSIKSSNGGADDLQTGREGEHQPEQSVAESEGHVEPRKAGDNGTASDFSEAQTALLMRCIDLWRKYPDPLSHLLDSSNISTPPNGVALGSPASPQLISAVVRIPKNPKLVKGGYLLVPSHDTKRWVKRFVELRRPYMHIYSVSEGDEVALVSLSNARVDSQPGISTLLAGPDDNDLPRDRFHTLVGATLDPSRTSGDRAGSPVTPGRAKGCPATNDRGLHRLSERMRSAVFAVYGTDNTWLFVARSERDKMDWILRIDQTYLGTVDGAVSGTPHTVLVD